MLLVAASFSYKYVAEDSCHQLCPWNSSIEYWANNEVYEKILFAGLESGFFKQSKITHEW